MRNSHHLVSCAFLPFSDIPPALASTLLSCFAVLCMTLCAQGHYRLWLLMPSDPGIMSGLPDCLI